MGAINAHAFFVAMIAKMEIKWNLLYAKRAKMQTDIDWAWLKERMEMALAKIHETRKQGNELIQRPKSTDPNSGSAVIVDDIILFAHTATALL